MCKAVSPNASPAPAAPAEPFPLKSVALLLLITLSDGIVITFLMPIVPFMVRSYGVEEAHVGSSAGSIASAYNLAQLVSGMVWGRVSDNYGRKPVILFGLVCTAASVVWFGVADSVGSAIAARVVGGLLNCNSAVTRAMLRECTPAEHRPRAFSSIGQAWGIGFFVGSMIGGALSRPADAFPALRGGILDTYPYLLPCVVSASFCLVGCTALLGLMRLEKRAFVFVI